MKISLLDKVLAASLLNLEFAGLSTQKTQDGDIVAVLQLSAPIEMVRGSQEIDYQGKRVPLIATDVNEVKVHQNDFEGIVWDEDTDTGSYKGSNLLLDVSKQGQVWLRSESFATGGQKLRRANQEGRLEKLMATMNGKSATTTKVGNGAEIVED